ncbi:MAG: endonuclease MutS2 [Treponema sp.]|nr:endonuclease MutS2 [Treponema sp.]
MNEKTLQLLEFSSIRSSVASLSVSEEAEKIILGEQPLMNIEEAEKLKTLVSSVRLRIRLLGLENVASLPDIGFFISKLKADGITLEIEEIYATGIFTERANIFKQWLEKPLPDKYGESAEAKDLSAISVALPSCEEVKTAIFKVLDREGNLRDLPELREIRKRIKALQKDIETAGTRFAKNEETKRMLQSDIPSQRDGRLVLAVKANFRGRIRGIVHEVSSSGQTIFVEPEEVVEKNNDLLIENRRLQAEIRRILQELTRFIAGCRDDLATLHSGILFLETLRARARYGLEKKWNVAAADPGGKLELKQARHPLLGERAVPLDLRMEGSVRSVIITGPNTGGKTVALKTLGLLAMMNQFGLALPVEEGTHLPMFDGIFADIGDEQSISQSLSTFSGHMKNISAILEGATGKSLVLLDELGSGTDPEEGSAIAMAILDRFIEGKTRLIVTTHHGVLKHYGYTKEGVENASMEFDAFTLSPTYRIIMGIPGESRAIDIALRNGLPNELIRNARNYLDDERTDVSELIAGLKEKHRALDIASETTRLEKLRLAEERRSSDLKELRLKQKELHLRTGGVGSLNKLLGESRKILENLVREVKEGELTREKTLKVKEFLAGLEKSVREEDSELEDFNSALAEQSRILEDGENDSQENSRKNKTRTFQAGIEVFAGESKRRGKIVKLLKKGTGKTPSIWVVEVGSLKMNFCESELAFASVSSKNDEKKNSGKSASWAAELLPSTPVSFELNLLGMRLPEALAALGKQIDSAALSSLNQFAVVHGKGDGILCKGVHDFLKSDPRVADYHFSRLELGGFGRTEVILKI